MLCRQKHGVEPGASLLIARAFQTSPAIQHQFHIANVDGLQGLGKTCMYCGDGINDLVALACADMGVAIGGGDAAAAAAFSTRQQSIGGTNVEHDINMT